MRVLTVLLLFPALASAQRPPVKLTVDPTPEAKPALRHELLPNARDRVAGNAVLYYLQAYAARPPEERDPTKRTAEYERYLRWEEAAPDKLPAKEVGEFLKRYRALFRELEYGARCKSCEWASAPAAGNETIDETLGHVQSFRELARWLSLRCKLEIAEGRPDDALRTIQTGLQFGKHVAEGPTLIQMLVGNAITSIFLGRIDWLLERPGASNLYWALSTLPKPFLDPRPGLDGEDRQTESFLPGLAELQKGPLSAERTLELVVKAIGAFQGQPDGGGLGELGLRVAITSVAQIQQAEARKEFLARGRDAKEVAAMSAVQVVYLNSFARYRDLADDYRKWILLGGPEGIAGIEKMGERVRKIKADAKDDLVFQVFLNILPATEKVFESLLRTDRRIAFLRTHEAIRIHAALSGQLPRELAEIKKVPVPSDPTTGKPFLYSVTDAGFTLATPETKNGAQLALKYEVTLRVRK